MRTNKLTIKSKAQFLNNIFKHEDGIVKVPKNYKNLWNPQIVRIMDSLLKEKKIKYFSHEKELCFYLLPKAMPVKFKTGNYVILDNGCDHKLFEIVNDKYIDLKNSYIFENTSRSPLSFKSLKKELKQFIYFKNNNLLKTYNLV